MEAIDTNRFFLSAGVSVHSSLAFSAAAESFFNENALADKP